jgi:hypothetical protein
LYTSLFITAKLVSKEAFCARLDSLIEQTKSNTPSTFARLLFLIRSINHGNAIISTYATNYEYIIPWPWDTVYGSYAPTQALIYDDNCSCGLYPNCTTGASFIRTNSTEVIRIKGFKIGCTPSESFLASTLECLYDPACINLIQEYTNSTNSSIPLSATMTQSSINTTIAELVNNLFIERWDRKMNYSSYYEQCSPLLCSYTYNQQFSLLDIVTLLIALQGGLAIVLELICPQIVRIIFKLYHHRKKRINIVQPISSLKVTLPTNVTSEYVFFYFHLIHNLYLSSLEQIFSHHFGVLSRLFYYVYC